MRTCTCRPDSRAQEICEKQMRAVLQEKMIFLVVSIIIIIINVNFYYYYYYYYYCYYYY